MAQTQKGPLFNLNGPVPAYPTLGLCTKIKNLVTLVTLLTPAIG